MNAYSKDLRLRVLAAVDRGMSRKEVVKTFGISLATAGRYLRRRREGVNRPELDRRRTAQVRDTVLAGRHRAALASPVHRAVRSEPPGIGVIRGHLSVFTRECAVQR